MTTLYDLSVSELHRVFDRTAEIKRSPDRYRSALEDKTLAMLFEKPSTRTRVSFMVGMAQLGGQGLPLDPTELQLGRGETVADTARVLSRYVDGIMARVFSHGDIEMLAEHAEVPVINGLSDLLHPCQAICDFFTIQERFGELKGFPVAYVGAGNNTVHSLARGASMLGVDLRIGTPEGYEPDEELIEGTMKPCEESGAKITVLHDPIETVRGAKVVYTDVWASMGQEAEQQQRRVDLQAFQVNAKLFAEAAPDAVFMHCLPAHRFEEVTDDVADHERSIIFDQAENRLHTQKALLVFLMG